MQWYHFATTHNGFSATLMEGSAYCLQIHALIDALMQRRIPAPMVMNSSFGIFTSAEQDIQTNHYWLTEPAYWAMRDYWLSQGAKPSGPPPAVVGGRNTTSMVMGDARAWEHVPGNATRR